MKFKFDNKTGHMVPKKDDGIYFSSSISGGLRVNDKLNNKKYIIEKDGSVKFLSGENGDLNIYNQHDAYLIAERVKRMLGRDHKYSNPKLFMKGRRFVESFENFCDMNEALWKSGIERAKDGAVRRENGIGVKLPCDKKVTLPLDTVYGSPIELSNGEYYKEFELGRYTYYIFMYEAHDQSEYTYFVYSGEEVDEPVEQSEENDMYPLFKIATADFNMDEEPLDFAPIFAMFDGEFCEMEDFIENGMEEMSFNDENRHYSCNFGGDYYLIFDSIETAEEYAVDYNRDTFDEIDIDKTLIDNWRNYFGNRIFNTDELREMLKEDYKNYVDDIESESGDMGYRLYDEMKEHGLIENTSEYFELSADAGVEDNGEIYDGDWVELDYENPKFDVEDMKEKLAEELRDGYDDPVEWYLDVFGTDGIENYLDKDKLAELCVDYDGVLQSIGYSQEHEYSGENCTIYIYKQ